jgi:putative ATP-dependent endonuclease of OLD family
LGLRTYAFYDLKQRKAEENQKLLASFDVPNETAFSGIEQLLVAEIPLLRQWTFLDVLRQSGEQGNLGIPVIRPDDEAVKDLMVRALKSNKGNGYAARLVDLCDLAEMPKSITEFLDRIYADFPKPEPAPLPPTTAEKVLSAPQPIPQSSTQVPEGADNAP